MKSVSVTRRRNALLLFKDFMEQQVLAGAAPKGLEQAFAAQVQISPSMWSQVKSSRPIGDTLARQFEALCGKPAGWLDQERPSDLVDQAEAHFVELARTAWRSAKAKGKRELLRQLKLQAG